MTDTIPTLFDNPEPVLPVLPYGATSGWSGSDTSRERAENADRTGKTAKNQTDVLRLIREAGADGLTWRDLARLTGTHHGTASGALSGLHKTGQIARLTERRDRCQIYVLPANVNGRPTSEYTPNVSARILRDVLTEIEQDLLADRRWQAIRRIRATLEAFDAL